MNVRRSFTGGRVFGPTGTSSKSMGAVLPSWKADSCLDEEEMTITVSSLFITDATMSVLNAADGMTLAPVTHRDSYSDIGHQ